MLAMQLRNMAGQIGYTPQNQNMYNIFGDDDDTIATVTNTTNIAALTTSSTITGGQTAATIQALVIQAINQLSANQTMLINQIAAMSFTNANNALPQQYTTTPMQQVSIPAQAPYAGATTGGFNIGREGRGRTGRGCGTRRAGG
jgi:hypothetical protein